MRFDRSTECGGMKIDARVENGKAYLEFAFCYDDSGVDLLKEKALIERDLEHRVDGVLDGKLLNDYFVRVQLYDRAEREVFRCTYPVAEEEPLQGILLHPHLWNGMEDAYFYRVCASLVTTQGCALDVLEKEFVLRTLEEIPAKGWCLNGKPFAVRGVLVDCDLGFLMRGKASNSLTVNAEGCVENDVRKNAEDSVENGIQKNVEDSIYKILLLLKDMGANVLYLDNALELAGITLSRLRILCEKVGFVVLWDENEAETDIENDTEVGNEIRAGIKKSSLSDCSSLFYGETARPTNLYYAYKARWSQEPFVHICEDSIRKQENGSYSLTIYSNQKKLALYVNGSLFEFRTGEQEFRFEEIPAKSYPLQLSVEAGECNVSLSLYHGSVSCDWY